MGTNKNRGMRLQAGWQDAGSATHSSASAGVIEQGLPRLSRPAMQESQDDIANLEGRAGQPNEQLPGPPKYVNS